MPTPVAERSEARVYGRSLTGVAGSNPASNCKDNYDKEVQMKYREQKKVPQGHVCLSVVIIACCQVEVSATGRFLV